MKSLRHKHSVMTTILLARGSWNSPVNQSRVRSLYVRAETWTCNLALCTRWLVPSFLHQGSFDWSAASYEGTLGLIGQPIPVALSTTPCENSAPHPDGILPAAEFTGSASDWTYARDQVQKGTPFLTGGFSRWRCQPW